jgi:hypothetical protein
MARSRWPVSAFVVAAASTLALGGAAVGQSPPASPSGSGGPAVLAPSDAPNNSPAAGGVVTISDADGFAGAMAHSIAVGADGSLVMGGGVGADPARPDSAVMWHSVDGTAWTKSVLPKSAGLSAFGVAETQAGWVVIATNPYFGGALVFTSKDATKWKHGKDVPAGSVGAVISTPDGLLVASDSPGPNGVRPTMWRSANLKKWKKTELPGSGSGADIAQVPSGATVVLVDKVGDNHDHSSSYARSADGASWEAADFPVVASGPEEIVSAGDLGTAGDLFVQVVNRRTGDVLTGSIWTSPDGLDWTLAYEAPGWLSQVASGPTGIVLGHEVEVTSSDGVTWTASARPGLTGSTAAVVASDGRVVVADSGYGPNGPFTTVHVVPAPEGFVPASSPEPGASGEP